MGFRRKIEECDECAIDSRNNRRLNKQNIFDPF